MPNWSYNTLATCGKKEDVIDFLNAGLQNSKTNVTEISVKNLKHLPELTLQSWIPMPQIFKDYDTTNLLPDLYQFIRFNYNNFVKEMFPNEWKELVNIWDLNQVSPDKLKILQDFYTNYEKRYKEAEKEQFEKYGVIGWYQYNLLTLGTKWNATFTNWSLRWSNLKSCVITANIETAWSMPMEWLHTMVQSFPNLHFIMFGEEESNSYCGYYDANTREWLEDVGPTIANLSSDNENCSEYIINQCKNNFLNYIVQCVSTL